MGSHGIAGRRPASDGMKAAGITQAGEAVLTERTRVFDLPAEAGHAHRLIDELFAALQRVREHHAFAKGMGIAAPQ
jgi:hypothetical protein